jgi:hypothetical protein
VKFSFLGRRHFYEAAHNQYLDVSLNSGPVAWNYLHRTLPYSSFSLDWMKLLLSSFFITMESTGITICWRHLSPPEESKAYSAVRIAVCFFNFVSLYYRNDVEDIVTMAKESILTNSYRADKRAKLD